jgi:hypothetical protein
MEVTQGPPQQVDEVGHHLGGALRHDLKSIEKGISFPILDEGTNFPILR